MNKCVNCGKPVSKGRKYCGTGCYLADQAKQVEEFRMNQLDAK